MKNPPVVPRFYWSYELFCAGEVYKYERQEITQEQARAIYSLLKGHKDYTNPIPRGKKPETKDTANKPQDKKLPKAKTTAPVVKTPKINKIDKPLIVRNKVIVPTNQVDTSRLDKILDSLEHITF